MKRLSSTHPGDRRHGGIGPPAGMLALVALCAAAQPAAAGQVVYVDGTIRPARSTAYDSRSRTCGKGKDVAYRSLQDAAKDAAAGWTVILRAGTYRQSLKPARSGRPGKPITFRGHQGEKATITGPSLSPAIDLSKRSHLVIEGLEIADVRRWLYAVGSHHNTLRRNHFRKAVDPGGSAKTGLFFQQATCNRIVDNVIEDCTADSLSLVKSDRNVVEGNVFKRAGHTLWTIKGGSGNVLRNNRFHNALQKIGEVYDCHDVGFDHEFFQYNCTKRNLIEGNRFEYTPSSGRRSPYAGIQYAGQDGIIRRNVFHDTTGPELDLTLYGKEANFTTGNRIYNNTFLASQYAGVSLSGSKNFAFSDNVLKNNILSGSRFVAHDTRWTWYTKELNGKPVQLLTGRLDGFVFESNTVFGGKADEPYLITVGSRSPVISPQRPVSWLQKTYPRLFRGNRVSEPAFVDEKRRDLRLKASSPLIDAGAFLTETLRAGSGTSMPVQDAGYFFDGGGIPGEKGDRVQLAGQQRTARVVRVDRKGNLLVLARALTWKAGQGVSLRYAGARPDVGAHEFVPSKARP